VLLPDCSREAVGVVIERLEAHASAQSISVNGSPIAPSLSVGCASAALGEGETLETLLSAADAAMYADKFQKKQRLAQP
jgi:PleD family two-component response regulator